MLSANALREKSTVLPTEMLKRALSLTLKKMDWLLRKNPPPKPRNWSGLKHYSFWHEPWATSKIIRNLGSYSSFIPSFQECLSWVPSKSTPRPPPKSQSSSPLKHSHVAFLTTFLEGFHFNPKESAQSHATHNGPGPMAENARNTEVSSIFVHRTPGKYIIFWFWQDHRASLPVRSHHFWCKHWPVGGKRMKEQLRECMSSSFLSILNDSVGKAGMWSTWAVQMLLVALSLRMCCSLVWRARRYTSFPVASLVQE